MSKSKKPACVKWECKSAALVTLKSGKSIQTMNGFITNNTGEAQRVCPKCAAFYGRA